MPTRRLDARRNRDAVLDAAITLLAEHPDASMQEIADASDLGRTTVYRHFSTRQDLIAAMLDEAVADTWRVAEEVIGKGMPVEQTLTELAEQMVAIGVRYRFIIAGPTTGGRALQRVRNLDESPIRRYLRECKEAGLVRDDVPVQWMMSSFQALCLAAMQDHAAGYADEATTVELLTGSVITLLDPTG